MTKTRGASVLAIAVTAILTLFNVEGSGALAQVPQEIISLPATLTADETAEPEFVSAPMVQELPVDQAARTSDMGEEAETLAQLVSRLDEGGRLDEQMRCLAGAIYFESKGEPLDGQLAVARVIVNRAESGRFPSSYCGVVYQRSQFSFVRGGRMPHIPTASAAWRRAKAIAQIAHDGLWDSPARGALFFHARRVNPGWRLTRIAAVENHIFYR